MELDNYIFHYQNKIESNGNSKDLNKSKRYYVEKLANVPISPQEIIEKKLVNYMKSVALRYPLVKIEAEAAAREWQHKVDQWLKENNLTEKRYLEQLDKNMRPIHPASPRLNGRFNGHQRSSGSDERQNYHSSSSQEVESPDSQKSNERSTSINHGSNHYNSFGRKSSSPLQFEQPASQSLSPDEFNANLSIDPKEVTPINKIQGSPVKPIDRFSLGMKENMFLVVKLNKPITDKAKSILGYLCRDMLKLPLDKHPDYIKEYPEHFIPSTSSQGARESSRSCPESKHDRRRSHRESSQSNVKSKESKEEHQLPKDSQNLLTTFQQGAVESPKSSTLSKHDMKKKHAERAESGVNFKELRLEKQPIQNSKNLPSTSQQGGTESSKTCHVSKHDRKRKHVESSQSVVNTKELNEEQQHSQDNQPKYLSVSRTHRLVRESSKESKDEQQHRTFKCREAAPHLAKANLFKDKCLSTPDNKLKLDSKPGSSMAMEGRNGDKNHTKKRDSQEQSAMVAITSSKKDRTSLYHGGRKSNVNKLQDLCIRTLLKSIKQHSDPTKYINQPAEFKVLEPILVLVGPEKLQKLEEEMKYLKPDTDDVWRLYCETKFKPRVHLKRKHENWRTFYERCCMESEERLRNVAASISASASKAKPDRQIKLTTVDGPLTKRPKTDHAVIAKSNPNNVAIKPQPNSCQPSTSRSDVAVPPKGIPNHIKSNHKVIKKDAPLMHKAKKTLGQLHRIHRN